MGLSYPDIAKRTGIPAERVRGKIKQALARGGNDPRRRFFDLDEFKFGTPFDLRGDFVIVGDVHVPATDWDLARLVSRVGGRCLAEPRLIIAGDMFNLDFASRFDPTVRYPHWSQERDAARAVLKEWRETFKDIYILMGNHDRRMIKWSAAELDCADLFGMVTTDERVHVSNYGWCNVTSGDYAYRVTHARNYSIQRLSVADQLALKYDSNIISFHEHHLGKAWDRYGRHVTVNGGCLVDPDKLAYAVLEDSKSSSMEPGFVLLRNGCADVLGRAPFTDWNAWV